MIGRGAIAESSDLLDRPPRSQRGEPVWEVAYCYPRQGDWSEADFLEFETANFPVELVDGCLEFLPMPTPSHQRLLRYLARRLEGLVAAESLGEVLALPARFGSGRAACASRMCSISATIVRWKVTSRPMEPISSLKS